MKIQDQNINFSQNTIENNTCKMGINADTRSSFTFSFNRLQKKSVDEKGDLRR